MTGATPIKVGITGGIGSGKSTVCRVFGMLGVPVYDSDARAKELMSESAPLAAAIKETFGEQAYQGQELDRGWLASKVFGDREALATLNGLVHPAVMEDFYRWAAEHSGECPYVLMESAVIFDNNLQEWLDLTITVSAPEQLRIERTMARDAATREKVLARMASQMSDEQRESKADFIIRNDERDMVWEQVLALDKKIRDAIQVG